MNKKQSNQFHRRAITENEPLEVAAVIEPRLAAHTTVVNGTRYWGNKQAIKKLREKARKLKRSK